MSQSQKPKANQSPKGFMQPKKPKCACTCGASDSLHIEIPHMERQPLLSYPVMVLGRPASKFRCVVVQGYFSLPKQLCIVLSITLQHIYHSFTLNTEKRLRKKPVFQRSLASRRYQSHSWHVVSWRLTLTAYPTLIHFAFLAELEIVRASEKEEAKLKHRQT